MPDPKDSLLARFPAHRDRLLRFLRRRLGCADTAEDLAQEAWVRVAAAGSAAAVEDAERYLLRVAANLAIDHRRAERRRRLTPLEAERMLELPDDGPDAADAVQGREEIRILRLALAEMPERRRAIFVAARLDGEPHRTIAARHGVSQRTVELELRRALEECAERIGRLSARGSRRGS